MRAYPARCDSRLQREETWWWADAAQCHGAPVMVDPSQTAGCKGFS
jgi:hypothetical protein